MKVKFVYEYVGNGNFGEIFRPVARVSFNSPTKKEIWTDTWMIVDTGADFSILPNYLAHDLGISLEKDCKVDRTIGVGGEQSIFLLKKKIIAKIGNIKREVPLAFFDNDQVPALLGRLGFLETFDTEFTKKHIVVFNA